MKRIVINICTLALSALVAGAASVQFSQPQRVEGVEGCHPVLSADGNKFLYTTDDYCGLKIYDFATSTSRVLSTALTAGFSPVWTDGGDAVLCRRTEHVGMLRNVAIDKINITTAASSNVMPLGRHDITTLRDGSLTPTLRVGKKLLGERMPSVAVSVDFDRIVVSVEGVDTRISPVADSHSYLWASLSPNRNRIVFAEPFQGVFTCNLDGSDLHHYGRGEFPVWLDDEHIVMVKSSDDGYFVTASRLYVVNTITAAAIALTPPELMASEATIAAGRIVFATEHNEIYTISYTTH